LSGRGLCDELITRPEESYRLCCVVVCDLETSRMGAPYIYDISRLRVKSVVMRWGRYGARSGGKNIPTSMRDIYTKYDNFKSQAYKEHYTKIQVGEMEYENTD